MFFWIYVGQKAHLFLHSFLCCLPDMPLIFFSSSFVLWLLPSFYEFPLCSHIIMVHKSSLIKISVFTLCNFLSISSLNVLYVSDSRVVQDVQNTWVTKCMHVSGTTCTHTTVYGVLLNYAYTSKYWSILAFSSVIFVFKLNKCDCEWCDLAS